MLVNPFFCPSCVPVIFDAFQTNPTTSFCPNISTGLKSLKRHQHHNWLVVWLPFFIFPLILGMSSSQLTYSYFSEGWRKTTNQINNPQVITIPWWFKHPHGRYSHPWLGDPWKVCFVGSPSDFFVKKTIVVMMMMVFFSRNVGHS